VKEAVFQHCLPTGGKGFVKIVIGLADRGIRVDQDFDDRVDLPLHRHPNFVRVFDEEATLTVKLKLVFSKDRSWWLVRIS
jgi:hypothetical protein